MSEKREIFALIAALLATFFWSISYIWTKIAYYAYEPITVILFRLIISSILILIVSSSTKRLQKMKRGDIKYFLLIAFFEPFLYFLGESYGLKYVSSTVAAVIIATIPVFTPIATWLILKERVKVRTIIGISISFIGVLLVVLNQNFQLDASPLGIALEFLAVFSAISYAIVLKKIAPNYNTLSIITYQNIIGVFYFLPLWFIVDFENFLKTPFHPQAFRAIVILAVFASTMAFIFFTESIKRIGITRSNMFVNLIPIIVAILAWYTLDEPLTTQNIIGITIAVIGLFVAHDTRQRKRRKKTIVTHQH